ncbi:acyl-CoA N-acyltransferase [Aspergillus granulosus]|uniref:Acyl-CoA N-acyltransferase n=1 Tax=Aspergillus granulosus TaxID=176169 RepID=A0ABR4HFB1_9EURO
MINITTEPFRSKRLIYRAIEDNDDDKSFFHTHTNELAMHLLASTILPRPRSKTSSNEFHAIHRARLLSVMICLPRGENGSEPQNEDAIANGKAEAWQTAIPIGRLSLNNPMGAFTSHHRNAIMGISLIESARGKGYGREAINWALDWAFEIAGLHRVSLDVLATNVRALRLYQSVGFVEEGRQREAVWQYRKWHDVVELGILEDEWLKLRKEGRGEDKGASSGIGAGA